MSILNDILSAYQIELLNSLKSDAKNISIINGIYLSKNAERGEKLLVYITLDTEDIPVSVTEFCLKYRNEDIHVSVEEEGIDFPQTYKIG